MPAPKPPHALPTLVLVDRRAATWLFGSAALAVLAVWISEALLGLLAPSDRIAYPMLAAVFIGVALLARRHPGHLLLAQRVAVVAIQAYLVLTAWALLQRGPSDGAGMYAIASLGPWAIGAQLFLFASWPPRSALALALLAAAAGPIALLGLHDPDGVAWRAEVAPLLLNTLLAECLAAAVLYGLARQMQRLIGTSESDMPRTLTVDELVRRRHAERQRMRQADDQASLASLAVASREAELHAVLEAFPGMVAWSDERGIYQYANGNFTSLYDLTPAQVVGRPVRDIIGPERAAETMLRRQQLLAAGRPLTFERHMTHPRTGEPVHLLVTHFVMPPRTAAEGPSFCQFAMDISDRKRTEAALVAARDLAERASRAKSEFLSRMSHELRTPMNAVLGFGQLLEMDRQLAPRHALHVREILRGGRHLLVLIDEVLDLARVEAGRIELQLEALSLAAQLDESLALVRPLAQARDIRLVAAAPPQARVTADATRLRQVLINLLSNAIKYNRDAGEVRIDVLALETGWRINVADTGPGIAAEQRANLFEPFNRLGAQHGSVTGHGIGLVITRRLLEAMGGRIGLDSPPEGGCCFWVELPGAD